MYRAAGLLLSLTPPACSCYSWEGPRFPSLYDQTRYCGGIQRNLHDHVSYAAQRGRGETRQSAPCHRSAIGEGSGCLYLEGHHTADDPRANVWISRSRQIHRRLPHLLATHSLPADRPHDHPSFSDCRQCHAQLNSCLATPSLLRNGLYLA